MTFGLCAVYSALLVLKNSHYAEVAKFLCITEQVEGRWCQFSSPCTVIAVLEECCGHI